MISRKLLEIIAVFLTAIGKFVFMDYLEWRFPYVVGASLFWLLYIIYRWRVTPEIFKDWGFRKDNFKEVLKSCCPLALWVYSL